MLVHNVRDSCRRAKARGRDVLGRNRPRQVVERTLPQLRAAHGIRARSALAVERVAAGRLLATAESILVVVVVDGDKDGRSVAALAGRCSDSRALLFQKEVNDGILRERLCGLCSRIRDALGQRSEIRVRAVVPGSAREGMWGELEIEMFGERRVTKSRCHARNALHGENARRI